MSILRALVMAYATNCVKTWWKGWPLLWNAWKIIPKNCYWCECRDMGRVTIIAVNWLKNYPKIVADWCECRDMGRVVGLIGAPARAKWPIRGSGFSLPAETVHHFFSQFSQQVFNKIMPKFLPQKAPKFSLMSSRSPQGLSTKLQRNCHPMIS